MMHRAWSSIVEVPYSFTRSYVNFQGHTALKIVEFDPNWAFPDCNSSLNSPMAMKCCTKLETAKERCPIVFQGHPSNFKVTQYKTSPILTQIGRFRTIGRSQLSNPSDLPCLSKRAFMLEIAHGIPIIHENYKRHCKLFHIILERRELTVCCNRQWDRTEIRNARNVLSLSKMTLYSDQLTVVIFKRNKVKF